MGLKTLALVAWAPLIFAQWCSAGSLIVDPSVATASAVAPGSIIEDDLKPRTWSVNPALGYFTGSATMDSGGAATSVHGVGGTTEAEYSMTEHLGLNLSAMGFHGEGAYTPGMGEGGTSGDATVGGWFFGAALVLDPFTGSGFRLPFFAGLNYQHLTSSTPTSPVITSMTLSSPGSTFGFSPRFSIGSFRFQPFMVVTTPFNSGNVTCSPDVVSGACGAIAVQMLPVFGVNVIFIPWHLSFYFDLLGSGVAFYSLGPHLSF